MLYGEIESEDYISVTSSILLTLIALTNTWNNHNYDLRMHANFNRVLISWRVKVTPPCQQFQMFIFLDDSDVWSIPILFKLWKADGVRLPIREICNYYLFNDEDFGNQIESKGDL